MNLRWKYLLAVFKIKRFFAGWYGIRRLDYTKKDLFIHTTNIREWNVRARSVTKEPGTVAWLEREAGRGGVLYDVGANIGAYTLIAAVLGMKVVAFEPTHFNIASLGANVFLNNLEDKVVLVSVALGREAGLQVFSVTDPTPGSSRGFYPGATATDGKASGPVKNTLFSVSTVDALRGALQLPPPSAVKIDVDGGEVDVLKGMDESLRAAELRSVLVESSDTNRSAVIAYMKEHGFTPREEVRMDARTVNLVFDR